MQRVKFFAAALVLALSGAVYAAGYVEDDHNARGAKTSKAACCAAHKAEGKQAAMSCDKAGKGCCAAHKATARKASAGQKDGEGCCSGCGGGCCSAGQQAGR